MVTKKTVAAKAGGRNPRAQAKRAGNMPRVQNKAPAPKSPWRFLRRRLGWLRKLFRRK